MRVLFMGSPDFALPCLDQLLRVPHQVMGVVTQPDRPKGRGNQVGYTPVKERALENNIPVYQPEKVNDPAFIELIRSLAPEVIVVVAFGQILKPALLDIPPLGCINVHASLLPQYRGSAPIHWAVINGEKETGVTTMYMDAGMDTGDMILKQSIPIEPNDTTGMLHDKLAAVGAEILIKTLILLAQGQAPRVPQDHHQATYAPLLKREHEWVDWEKTSREVHNLVRGMNPWPGAYTTFDSKVVKVWETRLEEEASSGVPGTLLAVVAGKGIKVQCRKGSVWLTQVQPQGKRIMEADAFARGYRADQGRTLGSDRL
ncbi:methionyl-tRNA formyltransferase [Candidatus Formimonas warabiya]|uniref:Methionyl-tRNA formyltransferase n=1 Tax=Formimonas warabiya TaxID=1761012 RepID=A0A3G1KQI6_FORW1|nr:methionyl-tRNA formyltransferase [Candidatus Formimonas warabiya]ATW24697.1 methionyl-tRNA formyltransferase [Candidatus Formimonas warabiya]